MAQQYPGVTPPISMHLPTEDQIKSTTELVELLKSYGLFEPEEEARKR
jgi:poly(A) polymerase Pap1